MIMKTIIGQKYIVPVITLKSLDKDGNPYQYVVIDNLHGDKENGQPHRHYHIDTRFEQSGYELRIDEHRITSKDYEERVCIALFAGFGTGVDFLVNSKIRRCITPNGRCPHKGYDLSTIEPDKNGEIHCPLHDLKFNAKTGQMIEAHQRFFNRKIMMDTVFPEFSLKDRNTGVVLSYEFPYIDPRIPNYEQKKIELLKLRKERESKITNPLWNKI
jgi:nitrite reductase/ring-hydroxylating ferredoxin subunit